MAKQDHALEFQIEIINFDKFNPRNDVKHSSWFRMSHTLAFDPEWEHFDGAEMWVWAWLMSLASFKNRSVVAASPATIAHRSRVPIDKVLSAIQKLTEKECINITSRARNGRGTRAVRPRSPTDGRTDGRNGRDETDETGAGALPPLAEIWNSNCGDLPKAASCGKSRLKAVNERWGEKPDPDHWKRVAQKLAASPFCRGENDRGWVATFDFFIRPETQNKAIEGAYDGRPRSGRGPSGGHQRGGNLDAEVQSLITGADNGN